jgi:type II secretory pathway predicted ATPase ExeA
MYERFFGLSKTPFSLVPDASCVHLTTQHADAISGLAYGILDRKGYLLLTGEAGLGKTTALCALRELLAESKVQSSIIFNPILTANEFLEMVLLNFGLDQIPASKSQRLKILEYFLVGCKVQKTVTALIVDEAHKLSPDLLEEVRLLGNFESDGQKLLQIVLVGQSELRDRLNLPELWQLKQRIALRMMLERLDRGAVEQYVEFRWDKAGGTTPSPFTAGALEALARWSNGIPRLVNVISDNALLIAFSETSRQVTITHVREACTELSLPTPPIGASAPADQPQSALGSPRSFIPEISAPPQIPEPPKSLHQPSVLGPPKVTDPPKVSPNGVAENGDGPKFWLEKEQPSLLKRWMRFSK